MPQRRYAPARMADRAGAAILHADAGNPGVRSERTDMKMILCAVDGSESAGRALDFATELAKDSHASLAIMAVRLPPIPARGGSIPILPVEDRAGARRVADDASERARHAGIATITIVAV